MLQAFFDDPETEFQLREISRKTDIAPTSAKLHLRALVKEGLLLIKPHRIHKYPLYAANRNAEKFKLFKRINTIALISESGLLDHLTDVFIPDATILFGSSSKGEDTKDSDLDIFMLCREKRADLGKFEKATGRRINLFFAEDFSKLSKELKNNIINGILLRGYLKVF